MPEEKNYCVKGKCTANMYGAQCACTHSVIFGMGKCPFLKTDLGCDSRYAKRGNVKIWNTTK